MDLLLPLRRLLKASADAANPSAEELDAFFHRIRTIAVVGLSRDRTKTARRIPTYLSVKGFEVLAVNPKAGRIFGRDAYATLAEVDSHVDLVVIFRPSAVAGEFVTQAFERADQPAIWLQEGIFAEPEIQVARAAGRFCVQDLCTYKVHRAIFT